MKRSDGDIYNYAYCLQDQGAKISVVKPRHKSDYNYWKECINHYIKEEDAEQLEQKRAKTQSDRCFLRVLGCLWVCVLGCLGVCAWACMCVSSNFPLG